MKKWIERALNIHPGDLGRGALLCSCLFLIISAYVTGKVARDALFLARFQAIQLPYADIASAVLVGLVVAGYVYLARRLSLRTLLVGSQLFFAINCAIFWALVRYYHLSWLFPVFYVWVGMFGVLAPTQVWTLANYAFTTREAKRIFGLVGGGAIAGWIFAGFFSKTVAKAFGTEGLLLGMALLLLPCSALMLMMWQRQQLQPGDPEELGAQAPGSESRHLGQSMRLVVSSRYLQAIAAVICISSFVTTLTGWQFKAVAKHFLVTKDALAVFFGNFNFYAGVLSLLLQLLLTTRCVRRFGISKLLFVLPVVVFAGSVGLLALGTLAAAVFLKGNDQVLRYSIDKSMVELLYLPLPGSVRLRAKWFIDTVIWRMGDGLAGITVLIFATFLHLSARQISWIALLLISGWLVAVAVARRQYVITLEENISRHKVDVEQASALVLDRSTSDLLAAKISTSDPKEILYALSLFEMERRRTVHPVVRGLLTHPDKEVRQKALAMLDASGDTAVLPQVQRLLKDPELDVRTEAMLYLAHHGQVDPLTLIDEAGDFGDFSVRSAVVSYLARAGETQNLETARQILEGMAREPGAEGERTRIEAAKLLGELPDCFDPLLSILVRDVSVVVAREAIGSVGKLRKRRMVPDLLDLMANQELVSAAAQALGQFGDAIVGSLRDHIADSSVPSAVRRAIPGILVSVGTPAAARVLGENLLERDTTLRFGIICALNKLQRLHPEVESDTQMLETVLAAEILGHYRSYQILAKLDGLRDSRAAIGQALDESMHQELERIFRLLGLLYPHVDVHSAYLSLQSKKATVYDNALEFLDNVLKSQLRAMLVPLLDGRVSVAQRAAIADRFVRTKVDNQEQAVEALVGSDDPWLRSCGAYAIGVLGIKSLEGELIRCLNDPDPLLRETARSAKGRLEQLGTKAGSTMLTT
ncbi:MAG: HEAT repeat domain-containing protein [Acidobacteria bacterium]|nr:HEAT repeat domain-containing protein [Acidobacteriota bacterium]